MKLPPRPPGMLPQGRLVDPRSPDARESAICAAVADLITKEDVDAALEALRRGLKATTTVRAPKKPGSPMKNDYMVVDDVPSQLAAIRLLLAYKFGNPSSVIDMRIAAPEPEERLLTHDEMLERLREAKVDVNGIIDVWLGAARQVSESGPLPADVSLEVGKVEALRVIDV